MLQGIVVLSFVVLAIPLWRLQIVEGSQYRLRADQNRFRLISTDAPRGVIYDRSGHVLARNMPRFRVGIVPNAVTPENEDRILGRVAELLNSQREATKMAAPLAEPPPAVTVAELRKKLKEGQVAPYRPVIVADGIPRKLALMIMEESLDLPGVQVLVRAQRQYLEGPLLSQVIGYVGNIPAEQVDRYVNDPNSDYSPQDKVGLTGVERAFEHILRGRKGKRQSEVDVVGREVRTIAETRPTPGDNLILTIDLDLQRAADKALQDEMATVRAKSGVVIAMNPQTGEILALVSLPTYDDNLFIGGISSDDYRRLTENKYRPLLNHAISGVYPPGSTFKIVTAAAGLEEKVIDQRTYIYDPGIIWLPNKYFPDDPSLAQPFVCWYKKGHGRLNVVGALAQSCDVFFYEVAGGYQEFEGLGIERLAEYAKLFGFGGRTGIDLPGEVTGLVPNKKWKRLTYGESWVTGDTYNMGIGQGAILVTPLQILNATAAIANGGTLYRPQIVYQVQDADGHVVQGFQPDVIRKLPISKKTIDLVRQGLRQAVVSGTAWHAGLPNVAVSGKTGTAEFPGPRDREGNLPTHAWFTAFAPYKDPQIAVVAFIYSGGEGSAVAVPVVRRVLEAYFQAHPLPSSATSDESSTPSGEMQPGPPAAATPKPSRPPGTFTGRVVAIRPWEKEISILSGHIFDRDGVGLPGVQITLDGGGPPVAQFATGPNGGFRYDYFNPASSPQWNIRLPDMPGQPMLSVKVKPYKHYVVEFRESK